MTPQPLISVCIPVYNGEIHVSETIQSVLGQTYPNIEVLVQDNASTDNTWRILQSLAKKDSRLFIERNDQNYGMAGNWNIAINRARGEYVMLLSADDLLMPEFIEKCMRKFAAEEIDAVATNHYYLRGGIISKRKKLVKAKTYQAHCHVILLFNPFSINFTLFRKALIDQVRNNKSVFRSLYTCDYDLNIRLSMAGARINYLEECMGLYRVHESNLSKQVKRMLRQTALVIFAHKNSLKENCHLSYRVTVVRFIARAYIHAFLGRFYDRRLLRILWNELFT